MLYMKRDVTYYENVALSNVDICNLLNKKSNLVLYPNLYKYNNLDQVLGKYGACVILFEARPNYGHWVCIFKLNNSTIEFFNPYGGYPDDSLDHIPDDFRDKTNQCYPYLSKLILDSPYELTYNEFDFQEKKGEIKTCGRHCVVRLSLRNLSLYKYKDLLDKLSKKMKLNYDGIVTLLTIK